jgi:hypothetical protein
MQTLVKIKQVETLNNNLYARLLQAFKSPCCFKLNCLVKNPYAVKLDWSYIQICQKTPATASPKQVSLDLLVADK